MTGTAGIIHSVMPGEMSILTLAMIMHVLHICTQCYYAYDIISSI